MSAEQIVVGIDGTEGGNVALEWALAEAASRHASVRLVHALGDARTHASLAFYADLPVPGVTELRHHGQNVLDRALAEAETTAPDVEVHGELADDDAVTVLTEASKHADLIVVGSHGRGPLGSLVIGSVGAAVSARASGPVVVVRGPAGDAREHSAVVVGVDLDGSPDALAFAFDAASRHGLPVHAVMCWHPDWLAEMMWRAAQPAPHWLTVLLDKHLAPYVEKYPTVPVQPSVVREHAVDALVSASAAQALLVIGEKSRHPDVGTLLGSVSQGVLHHATCPVAVVR